MEYIEAESFDSRAIEILIIDEADRMLDMGFIGEVDRIVGEARWRKQTMLFSATLEGAGLKSFSEDLLKDPAEFLLNRRAANVKRSSSWSILLIQPNTSSKS